MGHEGRRQLSAVIGYSTIVSMILNAHQLPLPEGATGLPPVDYHCLARTGTESPA